MLRLQNGLTTIYRIKMHPNIDRVVQNKKQIATTLEYVQRELNSLRNDVLRSKKNKLQDENSNLVRQIEAAKSQLIALEIKNGKQYISVPGVKGYCTLSTDNVPPQQVEKPQNVIQNDKKATEPKEKKPKKEKPISATNAKANVPVSADVPIDVGRLDMRVGKIIEVNRHPDADSLYLEKIDIGEAVPRTVVSGLVKFVPIEQMQNRMVVVLCNLKPAKMRGVTSEAMVMCASTPDKVEVLSPPEGAVPGDLVHCEGYTRQPDLQLNPKKKIFETCAPDLMTNAELAACYKGTPLTIPGKGKIVAQTLKNVHVK